MPAQARPSLNSELVRLWCRRTAIRVKYHFGKPLESRRDEIFSSYLKTTEKHLELGRVLWAYFNLGRAMRKYAAKENGCWPDEFVAIAKKVAGALAGKHDYNMALRLLGRVRSRAKEEARGELLALESETGKGAAEWCVSLALELKAISEDSDFSDAEDRIRMAIDFDGSREAELKRMVSDWHVAEAIKSKDSHGLASAEYSITKALEWLAAGQPLEWALPRKAELGGMLHEWFLEDAKYCRKMIPDDISYAKSPIMSAIEWAPTEEKRDGAVALFKSWGGKL